MSLEGTNCSRAEEPTMERGEYEVKGMPGDGMLGKTILSPERV